MKSSELFFERPISLNATEPPERRGLRRDEVRLLVSTTSGHHHVRFYQLADFLQAVICWLSIAVPRCQLVYQRSVRLVHSYSIYQRTIVRQRSFRLRLLR